MKIWRRGVQSLGYLLLLAPPLLAGAVKRSPLLTSPDVNSAGDHYRGVLSLLETHAALSEEVKSEIHQLFSGVSAQAQESLSDIRHFDRYLSSLATALVSLSEKVGGPYLQSALAKILNVTEKTLKPGILDQHAASQQALARADQGVLDCYSALWKSLNASNAIRESLPAKSQAIKSCHSSAAAASSGAATALLSLPRLMAARTSDCEHLLAASDVAQAPLHAWATSCDHHDSPSVGTYLMKQLVHWEELLQRYDDIEKRCQESTASYETQVARYNSLKSHQQNTSDCEPLQADMDAAACKQALDRIESCGTYGSCINESIEDRATIHESQCKLEVNLKAQWYALESVNCLLKAYEDHEGSKDLVSKFATCKSRTPDSYNLQFLELKACHHVEAGLADALHSVHSASKTSRECAITNDSKNDPSMAGTTAYESTYYRGFEPTRCTAKCCSDPPYRKVFTTTASTTTTTTTSTSTITRSGEASCNATSINVELSKQGRCTKLADGHDRWVNDLAPTPGTPKEDLKEFGLALAVKSAKQLSTLSTRPPDNEIPHVVMDKNKQLTVYLKHSGTCSEQQSVLQRVLPAGRSLKLNRCKGSDDFFV